MKQVNTTKTDAKQLLIEKNREMFKNGMRKIDALRNKN